MSYLYKTALDKIPFKSLTDKCIVLDLDETLVHSNESLAHLKSLGIMVDPKLMDLRSRTYEISMDDVVYKKGQGIKSEMWGIIRPHVKEFLIACFSYFKVVTVWSAGKKKYVDAIVDFLFKDIKRPHVVYARDQCERTTDNILTKPLEKMIRQEPGLSKYMSLENTFIIDDRPSVFEIPNPDNGIQIPPYNPKFNIRSLRTDDIRLKQLMTWLLRPEVMNSHDVRDLDKTNIFNTEITVSSGPSEMVPLDYNITHYRVDDGNNSGRVSTLTPIKVNT